MSADELNPIGYVSHAAAYRPTRRGPGKEGMVPENPTAHQTAADFTRGGASID